MLALRPLLLAALPLLPAACIQFEHHEGTSASAGEGGGETGDDPTTGAAPVVSCDPLAQDCADGEACALLQQQFACITVTIDGGAGDVCVAASECGPGLACCPSLLVPGCDGPGCCASMCDVGAGASAGCPATTECKPALTGPNVPTEYQDYGVCKAK